jgi:hypothetical protein
MDFSFTPPNLPGSPIMASDFFAGFPDWEIGIAGMQGWRHYFGA